MAIAIGRYVLIESGVGGASEVKRRDLAARLFTKNYLVPSKKIIEFDDADAVSEFFGSESEEARRASFYFGFVSKSITRPKKISFSRWSYQSTSPSIIGSVHDTLSELQKITSGSLSIKVESDMLTLTGVNLSGAASFSDVASLVQEKIRTASSAMFTQATVTYDAVNSFFYFQGGQNGKSSIRVFEEDNNDLAGPLGWLTGALLSDGVVSESISETLKNSMEVSNNFGSFGFVDDLDLQQITEAATWNAQQNLMFQYHAAVDPDQAQATSEALVKIAGVGLTLNHFVKIKGEYPEMLPMMILAATDYSRRSATQNFMYQSASLTPTVTTDAEADRYDDLRINYYGETQTAGQVRQFYQRGVLCGGDTSPVDMNVYANEQWLKDDIGARILSLLLSIQQVPANDRGRSQLLSVLQSTINMALLNGVISVGRELTDNQKLFIGETTGDDTAWHQVETTGYWITVTIDPVLTKDGRTECQATYLLIYAKDDVVRRVEGTHTMI